MGLIASLRSLWTFTHFRRMGSPGECGLVGRLSSPMKPAEVLGGTTCVHATGAPPPLMRHVCCVFYTHTFSLFNK